MRTIQISEINFKRLQNISEPLVDTPDVVIARLIDQYEALHGGGPSLLEIIDKDIKRLEADTPGNLSHTRVRSATFNSRSITRPNWNKLVRAAHVAAIEQGVSVEDLIDISLANLQKGEVSDNGFHFLEGAGISIQGQAANNAWQTSLNLARYLQSPHFCSFGVAG